MRYCLLAIAALMLIGCPQPKTDSPDGPGPGEADTTSGAPAGAEDWVGTFEGEALSVTLTAGSGGLEGTIDKGGKTFDLEVKEYGPTSLSGSFSADGNSFGVTLERTDDGAKLTTGSSTFALKRKAPVNPLEGSAKNPLDSEPKAKPANPLVASVGKPKPEPKPEPEPEPEPKPEPEPAAGELDTSDWQTFRQGGVTLRYPPGWKQEGIGQNQDVLSLVPRNLDLDENGQANEVFLCQVRPVQDSNIKRADDPQVVQFLDQLVRQTFPYMSRTGQTEAIEQAGQPAIVLSFSGTSPTGGKFEARMFAVLREGKGLLLLAAATPERMQERLPTARAVFSTYGVKPAPAGAARGGADGPADPSLVGNWRHTRTHVSDGFSAVHEEYMLLKADGTCYWASKFMGGGDSGTFDAGGDGSWEAKGTWGLQGRTLTMRWDGGKVEVHEILRDQSSFMWKTGSSSNKLWQRTGR